MLGRLSYLSFSLLIVMFDGILGNIWDNVFSKYEKAPVKQFSNFEARLHLEEFSWLDINIRMKYSAKNEKIEMEIFTKSENQENSFFKGYLDFDNLWFQFSSNSSDLCIRGLIPSAFKIDISNTENIWRYLTYYEGKSENVDSMENGKEIYLLSLEEITSKFNHTIPELRFLLDKDKKVEKIKIKIIEESLNLNVEEIIEKDQNENFNFFPEILQNCKSSWSQFKDDLNNNSLNLNFSNLFSNITDINESNIGGFRRLLSQK